VEALVLIVAALAAFGWAAISWGVDSRDLEPHGRR
jgi:hypothetical protein